MRVFYKIKFLVCLILFLLNLKSFGQENRPYVRISQRDPRYLEFSDGQPYIPIGLNLIGVGNATTEKGLGWMENWMKDLYENKGNYIRLWLSDAFWEVEHQKSGVYDEAKARDRLDKIINLSDKYNFKVKATLEHFRSFGPKPGWSAKPWLHVSNGGTAATMEEFFTGGKSRQQFLKKLDWFANRFGQNPTIFAWELWNEVNATNGGGYSLKESQEQYNWTEYMLPEVKKRFPNRLATQSLGSFDDPRVRETYQAFMTMPSNDLAQVHRYLDLGAKLEICHQAMDVLAADAVKELRKFNLNKPVLLAESGGVEPNHVGPLKLYAADKAGILLHDVLFAPFFAGAAGPGQIWHWNDYVAKNNLWFHFARFAETVKNIDPAAENFQPKEEVQENLRVYSLKGQHHSLIWIRDTKNTWMTELRDGLAPELQHNKSLHIKGLLISRKDKIEIYDPWKNTWSDGKIKKLQIKLPDFSRSIVLRINHSV